MSSSLHRALCNALTEDFTQYATLCQQAKDTEDFDVNLRFSWQHYGEGTVFYFALLHFNSEAADLLLSLFPPCIPSQPLSLPTEDTIITFSQLYAKDNQNIKHINLNQSIPNPRYGRSYLSALLNNVTLQLDDDRIFGHNAVDEPLDSIFYRQMVNTARGYPMNHIPPLQPQQLLTVIDTTTNNNAVAIQKQEEFEGSDLDPIYYKTIAYCRFLLTTYAVSSTTAIIPIIDITYHMADILRTLKSRVSFLFPIFSMLFELCESRLVSLEGQGCFIYQCIIEFASPQMFKWIYFPLESALLPSSSSRCQQEEKEELTNTTTSQQQQQQQYKYIHRNGPQTSLNNIQHHNPTHFLHNFTPDMTTQMDSHSILYNIVTKPTSLQLLFFPLFLNNPTILQKITLYTINPYNHLQTEIIQQYITAQKATATETTTSLDADHNNNTNNNYISSTTLITPYQYMSALLYAMPDAPPPQAQNNNNNNNNNNEIIISTYHFYRRLEKQIFSILIQSIKEMYNICYESNNNNNNDTNYKTQYYQLLRPFRSLLSQGVELLIEFFQKQQQEQQEQEEEQQQQQQNNNNNNNNTCNKEQQSLLLLFNQLYLLLTIPIDDDKDKDEQNTQDENDNNNTKNVVVNNTNSTIVNIIIELLNELFSIPNERLHNIFLDLFHHNNNPQNTSNHSNSKHIIIKRNKRILPICLKHILCIINTLELNIFQILLSLYINNFNILSKYDVNNNTLIPTIIVSNDNDDDDGDDNDITTNTTIINNKHDIYQYQLDNHLLYCLSIVIQYCCSSNNNNNNNTSLSSSSYYVHSFTQQVRDKTTYILKLLSFQNEINNDVNINDNDDYNHNNQNNNQEENNTTTYDKLYNILKQYDMLYLINDLLIPSSLSSSSSTSSSSSSLHVLITPDDIRRWEIKQEEYISNNYGNISIIISQHFHTLYINNIRYKMLEIIINDYIVDIISNNNNNIQ